MKRFILLFGLLMTGCASNAPKLENYTKYCDKYANYPEAQTKCLGVFTSVYESDLQDYSNRRARLASSWAQGWGAVSRNYHDQAVINQMNANRPITGFEQPQQRNFTIYPMNGGGYIVNGQ